VLQVETASFDLPAKPFGIDQREIDLLAANPPAARPCALVCDSCVTTDRCPPGDTNEIAFSRQRPVPACSKISAA
jgi:hypothetical protein